MQKFIAIKKVATLTIALIISTGMIACTKAKPAPTEPDSASIEESAVTPTKAAKKSMKHAASTVDIQKALASHGMKVKVDGKMGPSTKAALKGFQKKSHLKVTGIADSDTLMKLGL